MLINDTLHCKIQENFPHSFAKLRLVRPLVLKTERQRNCCSYLSVVPLLCLLHDAAASLSNTDAPYETSL